MFVNDEKLEAIRNLNDRRVKLRHACQLLDLKTYLELGGIASRQAMTTAGLPFTGFQTDGKDKVLGTWGLVFGNLADFGYFYAKTKKDEKFSKAVPTPYGPITLVMAPDAISDADRLHFTIKSGDVKNSAIQDITSLNNIFSEPTSYYLKRTSDLKADFGLERASNPEFACKYESGVMPFEGNLESIVVEDYEIGGKSLQEEVQRLVRSKGLNVRVTKRSYVKPERKELLNKVANALRARQLTNNCLKAHDDELLKEWATLVNNDWQVNNFLLYLKEGTVDCL